MRSWPIWNIVKSCAYKSDKSYGVKATGDVEVRVGTSASNSETLVTHCTTRREVGDYVVFTFGVDLQDGAGLQVLKKKYMHIKTKTWFDTEPAELLEAA